MHEWTKVSDGIYEVWRFKVPGGWLYKVFASPAIFVPDSDG